MLGNVMASQRWAGSGNSSARTEIKLPTSLSCCFLGSRGDLPELHQGSYPPWVTPHPPKAGR